MSAFPRVSKSTFPLKEKKYKCRKESERAGKDFRAQLHCKIEFTTAQVLFSIFSKGELKFVFVSL